MQVRIEIEGLDKAKRNTKALPRLVAAAMLAEMGGIGESFAERAALNAPILKGDLRGAISAIPATRGDGGTVMGGAQVSGIDYAFWTHEGVYNLGPVSAQQPTTPEGGVGRKYLERVAVFNRLAWAQRMMKRIDDDLKGLKT